MRSRRAVGSLIGIGFLLMILALAFSYYQVISQVESSSNEIIREMVGFDSDAGDKDLEISKLILPFFRCSAW